MSEKTQAVEAPLQTLVRPLRWICRSCDWVGTEHLYAANPFDPHTDIVGCPKCKAVEDLCSACDEPGCNREATCGFPDPGGYRRTCHKHFSAPQWPNA
jgi:Zn finger protein HypA/HybF involved in hydrogenase expression